MQRVMRSVKQSVQDLPTSCSERKKVLEGLDMWDKGIHPIALIRTMFDNPYKNYTFLRRHFMHCGLWIHFMRTLFHQQGVAYAASPGTILYAPQVYHALRQEKSLKFAWKDLDTLREMQGNSAFFIGQPPSSFERYFNNFCLTGGASITNWAHNTRDKRFKISRDNRPLMMFLGVTSTLAANRIGTSSTRRPLSLDVVEDWIQRGSKSQDSVKTNRIQSSTPTDKKMRQPLVHSLAAAVEVEIPELVFDYFAIHKLCREVLLRLLAEDEKLKGSEFTRKYRQLKEEQQLAFVVGLVFSTAAGKKNIFVSNTESSTFLLETASETFNQWLSEGRGSAITGTRGEEPE